MPANLTPDYKAAEAAFRQATEPRQRLECLREMLRLMPKHKGTDHLQAEVKTRIKQLTEELAGPRKGGAKTASPWVIHPEGAAQIALLGAPNSGKSSLHDCLTHSRAAAAPYPLTTQRPQPGMLTYQDIGIQLIDLPAISPDLPQPWLTNALAPADGCLLLVDLGEPDAIDRAQELAAMLAEHRIRLGTHWGSPDPDPQGDPFALALPTLLIAAKADRLADADAEIQVFQELAGWSFPALAVAAATGAGLDLIGPWLFQALRLVRVYTKTPGKPPDLGRPFTVRAGQSVADVAELIHKDLARSLKYARLWGKGDPNCQLVGREHPVRDGDILEIHT